MPYKLLLFDLDGTLLTPDRKIHEKNFSCLQSLMKKGLKVGFSTGRTWISASPYAHQLEANGPLLLFNGTRIYERDPQKVVYEKSLPLDDTLLALKLGQELGLHANLYIGDDLFIRERTPVSEESEVKDGIPHTVVGNLVEFVSREQKTPVKIMFIGEPNIIFQFRDQFSAGMKTKCSIVNSEPKYMEVMPEGVNKGTALLALEELYGIKPSEIVAFGDGLNDVELLQNAGLSVAMGNAHDDLKPMADHVIGDHSTAAISEFLESL